MTLEKILSSRVKEPRIENDYPAGLRHLVIDIWFESPHPLVDEHRARVLAEDLIGKTKCKKLNEKLTYFSNPLKDINGKPFTYMAVVSSSHIAISTYVENNYMQVDYAWCSGVDLPPEEVLKSIIRVYGENSVRRVIIRDIYREVFWKWTKNNRG